MVSVMKMTSLCAPIYRELRVVHASPDCEKLWSTYTSLSRALQEHEKCHQQKNPVQQTRQEYYEQCENGHSQR